MTRAYYRLCLVALCSLAALAGPVVFLQDRWRLGYLLGGFGAALLTWAFLLVTIAVESKLHYGLQGIIGAGAGVLSWATISFVAIFDIIPHLLREGWALFDPVWLMAGFSPLIIPVVVAWRVRQGRGTIPEILGSTLFRFSVPLLLVQLVSQWLGLPKQYRWLFLFTGVMFLVLDMLGVGKDHPLTKG